MEQQVVFLWVHILKQQKWLKIKYMIQSTPIQKEIILNYDLAHILIQKTPNGLKADVQLTVTNQDGNFVESLVTTYEGGAYNKWWDDFNSWKAVLTPILENKEVVVPDDIEEEFLNNIEEV